MDITSKTFSEIIKQKGLKNTVFSPLSMELFSAILLFSTQGETQEQLMNLLNISENELITYKDKIISIIKRREDKYSNAIIKIANSLWVNKKFVLKSDYINFLKEDFDSDFFSFDAENIAVKSMIDNWVSEKTEKLIPKISINIDRRTLAVIINTLYFKAEWYSELRKENMLEKFFLLDGKSKNILYLTKTDISKSILYFKSEDFHAISIPYKDNDFCMEIYLPFTRYELPSLLNRLSELDLPNIHSKFTTVENIEIKIPPFDFKEEMSLNNIYEQLGADKIFEFSQDFSPMLNFNEGLAISEIKQNVRIKVDKKGTEAAAVTYGDMLVGGMSFLEEIKIPIKFYAYFPFLFLIRNRRNNTILFIGTVIEPNDFKVDKTNDEIEIELIPPKRDFWSRFSRFFGIGNS